MKSEGAFCPICKDWVVNPEEVITKNIEVIVAEHHETFHTIKEIEKYRMCGEKKPIGEIISSRFNYINTITREEESEVDL